MSRPIEEILVEKPEARLRIYAYEIHDEPHDGLLKIGQTTKDVKLRVAQQLQTAAIENYRVVIDESAERDDGITFSDFDVRNRLKQKGHHNTQGEWMRCTADDVRAAIQELRTNKQYEGVRHANFPMRDEQHEAVEKTYGYFQSIWAEDSDAVPEFLWNAKMRFGKTFTAYQLAKKIKAHRVLVMTFKPAVEDAWRTDLQSHV